MASELQLNEIITDTKFPCMMQVKNQTTPQSMCWNMKMLTSSQFVKETASENGKR